MRQVTRDGEVLLCLACERFFTGRVVQALDYSAASASIEICVASACQPCPRCLSGRGHVVWVVDERVKAAWRLGGDAAGMAVRNDAVVRGPA